VVREVLRLHPIFAGVRRDLSRPVRILGYDLPAGTKVVPCIYLAQRRPDAFPEPERFLPDRFLQQRPAPFEWMPFGGGVRRCVGGVAAPVQMKVVLSAILRRAVLRPAPGPRVRTVSAFISLAPSGGVPAVLVSRDPRGGRVTSPPAPPRAG
jgi:cytochrome P450